MVKRVPVQSLSDIHLSTMNNRQYINMAAAIANLNMTSFIIHNEEHSPSMECILSNISEDAALELRAYPGSAEYASAFGKEGIFVTDVPAQLSGIEVLNKKMLQNSRIGVKPISFSPLYGTAALVKASTLTGRSSMRRMYEITPVDLENLGLKKIHPMDYVPHYRRGLKKST